MRDIDKFSQEPGSPVLSLEKTTAGPVGEGTQYLEVVQAAWPVGRMQIVSTLTAFESPGCMEMDWDSGGMFGHLAYSIEKKGEGALLVQKETLYQRGIWKLLVPFLWLFFRRILQSRLRDIKNQLGKETESFYLPYPHSS